VDTAALHSIILRRRTISDCSFSLRRIAEVQPVKPLNPFRNRRWFFFYRLFSFPPLLSDFVIGNQRDFGLPTTWQRSC